MNIDYGSRRARNPLSGKNEIVDGDMTYSQWIDSLTPEEKAALELSRKKDDNKTSDKLQYKQYQEVIGRKNIPKSFDKFQELKYNGDRAEYEDLKHLYREVNWQVKAQENKVDMPIMPNTNTPNSVVDKVIDGNRIQRRYYGKTGKPRLDIDLTDHGNPKIHKVVPHYHNWTQRDKNTDKWIRDSSHDNAPEKWHIIANKDILG